MTPPLWLQILLWAGGAVTALTGIVTAIVKVKNAISKMKSKMDWVVESIKTLLERSEENHMDILRLTVMNPEMPLSERVIAGKKYIQKGGNGEVKRYVEEELMPHDLPGKHREFCSRAEMKREEKESGKEDQHPRV